jgi:hypothetical protein
MANGLITRKDIIEDQALTIGTDYAKNMQPAIEANKELVASLKEMAPLINAFRKTDSQQAYIALKQQENLTTLQAINANKLLEASELSLEKIKQSKLKTDKEALNVQAKEETAKKRNNQLTIEERVQNEVNNRLLKQEARERLGLVSAYEKLNRSRLEAQKALANLLSAEVKNNAEIRIAQREFDKLDARVKAVDAAIKNYSKNIGNYGSAFEGLNGTLQDLMSTFGLVTGLALFGTIVKDIFSIVKDFDRQLIAVGKTTNITGDDLKQFGREVVELGDKLDGITVDGLIQSAEVAGQLGVTGTANILNFSTAIEKLKLTSNIISDEQVGQFAKFIEVSSDSFENADKLASVITQLGNSFATTEAEVLANATEIQKGIAVYNTSAQGVLALGSATSTLGSEAESSRSAIQSTFAVINNAIATGANLEKVLKLTGLTQKELSKQFNQDATGVFVKFVKGLSDAKKEGQNLALVLNDVEITEKRAFTVIGSLAANYGILESSIAQANKEYIDNAALNKEVAAASESIASIIGDLRDKWEAYVLQTNDANSGSEALTKTLKFLRDNFKEIINFVLKAGTVLFTYLGIVKGVNLVMALSTALQTAWTAGQIRFALATGIGTESILAQAAAARTAMVAQEGLNVAVKATPWGLILGFLSAAVVAYMVFNDQLNEAEKNIQNIVDANKRLQDSEKVSNKEADSFREKRFKQIEDEIKLKKAQGGNSELLDKEEIARKRKFLQDEIEIYNQGKNFQVEDTKAEINLSNQRIAQFQIEKNALEKSKYRVSKQGRTSEDLDELIKSEKAKKSLKQGFLSENSKITTDQQAYLNKQLQDLEQNSAVKDAEIKAEEDKKAKAAREKAAKAALERAKKLSDSEYELKKQQLERIIKINEDVAKDEEQTDDVRISALEVSQKKQIALIELTKKHSLDADKFVTAENKLNANQKIYIANDASNKIIDINQKTADEIEKIKVFDEKEFTAALLKKTTEVEIASNKAVAIENEEYKKILENKLLNDKELEDAAKKHEENLFNIKLAAAKELANLLIKNTKLELAAYEAQSDGSEKSNAFILALKKKLSDAETKLTELGLETFKKGEEEKVMTAKEKAELTLEIAMDVTNELGNLASSFSEAKIQKIDDEIAKNNEYYDKQIELAGNDERQKDLLQKQRDKKNEALEKKKREAQHKQAIFDKAINIAMIAMATSLAVIKAWTEGDPYTKVARSIAAGVVGAIQLAAAIATPIPKYKMGRKGGPAEVAEVGDGGVHEVISRPDGSGARITPNKPTLTFLQQDDVVHKSMEDFYKYKRQSVMKGFYKEKQLAGSFHMNNNYNSIDNTKELLEIKEAIKKQKTNVHVTNKIDFGYENYRRSNINWRA